MRRLLRSLLAASVAFAFTGGVPVAMAMSVATHSQHPCEKPSQSCGELSLTRCCCAEDAHGIPASVPPTERTSVSKTQAHDGPYLPAPSVNVAPALACALRARPTHRAGPPISLSLLHTSLLL
jgi:hypothetical protein